MKSKVLRLSVAASVSAALVLTPVVANASPSAPSANAAGAIQNVTSTSWSLTASDWKEIAKRASGASDVSSARVANSMAAQRSGSISVAKPANVITSIAKKTALIALRYGADKLPKAMRPYANKIANFLDDLQNWQEGPIITGLVALGLPYDVAEATATWVVFFAGV
ncbi:hypothetical protein [Glutamicibacter sp. FBE19]|uniref:hypothetical protein n=1 Tax=Glutamicibacter sp. FBE19 TaxID=2761534 RepID=UPI0018966612|nr:hypothetical protein [Glutamicibacter sp. FBE19]MBF6670258.1 hypothetical protein [Glutamicibacter sp. FBE19]